VVGWLSNQPGFDYKVDLQKLKDDKNFSEYVLTKYYQSPFYKQEGNFSPEEGE